MAYNLTMDAVTACRSAERPWQAATRAAGLAMSARLTVSTPLQPILDQVADLLRQLPDAARDRVAPDGSWTSVWLSMLPDRPGEPGRPTPLLDSLPGLSALAAELGSPLGMALIARMPPGGVLGWHYDPVSADHEKLRLHLPVRTHPSAVTDLCHERVHWPSGGLYYGDYGFPHRVINGSEEERIHLYFDVDVRSVASRLPPDLIDRRRRAVRELAVGMMLAGRTSG